MTGTETGAELLLENGALRDGLQMESRRIFHPIDR